MAGDSFIIKRVDGLMVLDSRGTPTIKAVVETRGGGLGYGIAPSGASRGAREAVELRDGGSKWLGKGVGIALARLKEIVAPRLVGLDSRMQALIDGMLAMLDGTSNKSRLGANTTTALSIAVARAAASQSGLELFEYLGGPGARMLPAPLMNVINGGVHAGNELDFQEFMIVPLGFDSFPEALRAGVEVYWHLKGLLKERYGPSAINVGDEGGFAPPLSKAREALEALVQAIRKAGYSEGGDFYLGIDAAASQIYSGGYYRLEGRSLSNGELLGVYESLIDEYPIIYIEDPFHEDDFDSFSELTKKASRLGVLIVGDDLYTTNTETLKKGIEKKATNAALVKINQVGTLTETLDFIRTARLNGLETIISHRSGDTEDPFIADLAIATNSRFIKTGAPARSERTSKYNRLLEISEHLQQTATYAGKHIKI